MTPRELTKAVILIATIVLVAYDAWVYLKHGREATISVVLLDLSCEHPVIPLAFGLLAGHIWIPVKRD